MGFAEVLLIAVGLAMDAFAVSICRGLEMKKLNLKHAAVIAIFFGAFQAGMPLIGYFVGRQFEVYITAYDHWIAFGLLTLIGGKMIFDSLKKENDCNAELVERLDYKQLLVMSVATSIDALAIGVTFAFLGNPITIPVITIGVVTFIISFAGVIIGNRVGCKFKNIAEIIGGVVLILIGVKILLEHLEVIGF